MFRELVMSGTQDHDSDSEVVPAGSSSNVPADYVSAGYVLVPADR
ncbi:hypothetical protein Tco_0483173, partial [Tanacetum coccineum]